MREILFRGKTSEGRWVEGGFAKAGIDEYYIFLKPNFIPIKTIDTKFFIKVLPETVGQYTGLKDKNGKKIFEGDRVRQIRVDNCFGGKDLVSNVVIDSLEYYNLSDWSSGGPDGNYPIKEMEVIGNIHE